MNIEKQNMINELGKIVKKDCLTHNQSYKWLSGTSINSHFNTEELLPSMFVACIKQIVNLVISACRKYTNTLILASSLTSSPPSDNVISNRGDSRTNLHVTCQAYHLPDDATLKLWRETLPV
jgi:hypothetical protein